MQVKQSPDAAKAFACFLNGFTDFRKVIPNVWKSRIPMWGFAGLRPATVFSGSGVWHCSTFFLSVASVFYHAVQLDLGQICDCWTFCWKLPYHNGREKQYFPFHCRVIMLSPSLGQMLEFQCHCCLLALSCSWTSLLPASFHGHSQVRTVPVNTDTELDLPLL